MMGRNESSTTEASFARLIAMNERDRSAALRELIDQDRAGAVRLAALIDAHFNETLALDSVASAQFSRFLGDDTLSMLGTKVGGWTLVEEIGRGGMGVVFGVERTLEGVTQRAAMKLLSVPSFDADADARFIREVSVLARLDHPGICRLLDWGKSEEGWRYLVLERVDGRPISEAIDGLSRSERIELVARIAEALNVAHRDLVVHLDIKPDNILVNRAGDPVLLDFGISKILADDGLSATATVTRWLTPNYASPEQLRGEPASVAADIYALGVVLFRLLTGRSPYDVVGRSLTDALDEIELGSHFEQLRSRELGRDLQFVLRKAMHSDPGQRYASAQAFADDLRAFNANRPVSAQADSTLYRLRKLWQRHPVALPSALLSVLSIAGLAVLLFFQASDLELQRDRANREAARSTAANELLLGAIESANPTGGTAAATSVDEMLLAAVQRARLNEDIDPLLSADVLSSIAQIRSVLAEYDAAIPLYEQALALLERHGIDDEALRTNLVSGLLASLRQTEQRERAHAILEQESAKAEGRLGWRLSLEKGQLLNSEGQVELAREALQAALDQVPSDRYKARATISGAFGNLYFSLGQPREALQWHEKAVEYARMPPIDEEALALALVNMSNRLSRLGRVDEALAAANESVELRVAVFGSEHIRTIPSYINLAYVYMDAGRWEEAISQAREVIGLFESLGISESRDLAAIHGALGLAAERMGDSATAIEGFSRALEIQQSVLPEGHPSLAVTRSNLASRLIAGGDHEEGLALLEQAWEVHEEITQGEASRPKAFVEVNIADAMIRLGRFPEALAWAESALVDAEQVIEPGQWVLGHFRNVYADALRANGRFEEALNEARTVDRIYQASEVTVRPQSIQDNLRTLARIHEETGRTEQAAEYRARLQAAP
jgi:serine/threonine-protein kinase